MKTFTLLLVSTMIFSAGAAFACDGPCDKDKDDQAFTVDAQYLCGGSACRKQKSEPKCGEGCTCEKCSKGKENPAPKPEPAPEPEPQCGGSCGGDKDKKADSDATAMCGGSGCDKKKDKEA